MAPHGLDVINVHWMNELSEYTLFSAWHSGGQAYVETYFWAELNNEQSDLFLIPHHPQTDCFGETWEAQL